MTIYICRIYICDHIYVGKALGQNCQMYNKLAKQRSCLPYNISSSSKRVKSILSLDKGLYKLILHCNCLAGGLSFLDS